MGKRIGRVVHSLLVRPTKHRDTPLTNALSRVLTKLLQCVVKRNEFVSSFLDTIPCAAVGQPEDGQPCTAEATLREWAASAAAGALADTALYEAAEAGDDAAVAGLLEAGADVNAGR